MPTPHVSSSMIEDWRELPGNIYNAWNTHRISSQPLAERRRLRTFRRPFACFRPRRRRPCKCCHAPAANYDRYLQAVRNSVHKRADEEESTHFTAPLLGHTSLWAETARSRTSGHPVLQGDALASLHVASFLAVLAQEDSDLNSKAVQFSDKVSWETPSKAGTLARRRLC